MIRQVTLSAVLFLTGCAAEPAPSAGELTAEPSASDVGSTHAPASVEPSANATVSPPSETPMESQGSSTGALGAWDVVLDEGHSGRVNRLYDMARLGDRIIAIGESVHAEVVHVGPYERNGLIWVSDDDGATWRSVGDDPVFAGTRLRHIVVVAGEAYVFDTLGFDVWRSVDGERWELAALPGFEDDGWELADIAGGPLGWVMVGQVTTLDPYRNERQIWFSADWQSWELTRSQPGPPHGSGRGGEEWYEGVGAGPEGFVVAGQRNFDEEDQAWMLASADGRTWHVAPEQPALGRDMSPTVVAPLAGDWIAAGAVYDDVPEAPVWHSANGLDWRLVTRLADPEGRPDFGWGQALLSTADRLFLNTWRVGMAAEMETGVWTSLDGTNWELLDLDPAASVSAAIWLGDRWLLAGHIATRESRAAIWSSSEG